jgi:NAD(P)H-dependent FMN reductase
MTRILLIGGSLRRDSLNTRLLKHLAGRLRPRCTVDLLLPRDVELPLFDQDLEGDGAVMDRVAALHRRISEHDGFIVATPEYNGQMTAYLKNLVDWVSRLAYVRSGFAPPFCDSPVLLCSASTGSSGGSVAIPHARALFGYVGASVLGDTVCVPFADQAWNAQLGFLFDDALEQRIDQATHRLVNLAKALHSLEFT